MNDVSTQLKSEPGLEVTGNVVPAYKEILSTEALSFIESLCRNFSSRVDQILKDRINRQKQIDDGEAPDFLDATKEIRDGAWQAAPVPDVIQDRRVEITGPVDRKMIINALNSGAKVFMADFEDASSPAWHIMMDGQVNLRDAVAGSIEHTSPNGKQYKLAEQTATLFVRPRGWHLKENHVLYDGIPIPGSLWDFGLYFFHNAKKLIDKGAGPFFYLPKLQSHTEARLWNDVFNFSQDYLNIPRGTIKATVLIETILAAFEMDEIIYELRDHSAGLNCGRWDYIFSFIKTFQNYPDYVLPDRSQVTMTTHFLRSYSQLVIKTCHKRGVHAIGGMAAQIPVKGDAEANKAAENKVRMDKEREAKDGHDGSWVSHPALVAVCEVEFNQYMTGKNQINKLREDVNVTRDDLLMLPLGTITLEGLVNNISAVLNYTQAWLCGQGAVPLHNLMEDAATAEIARTQIWQWIKYPKGVLEDGRRITIKLCKELIKDEMESIRLQLGDEKYNNTRYELSAEILEKLICSEKLSDFLTLEAYNHLD